MQMTGQRPRGELPAQMIRERERYRFILVHLPKSRTREWADAGHWQASDATPRRLGVGYRRIFGARVWRDAQGWAIVAPFHHHNETRRHSMKKTLIACAVVGCAALLSGVASAADTGTPDEAKALSQKAQTTVNTQGKEKAFAAFSTAEFKPKDLYVFCMDMDGKMLSHPLKPELVGKNLLDFKKYGDELFKNMIAKVKTAKEGWVDYKWPYPGTEEIKAKTSYVMANKDGFFCGVGA